MPFDSKKEGDFISLVKLHDKLLKIGVTDVADIHNVLRTKVLRVCLLFRGIGNKIINKNRRAKKDLTRPTNKKLKQSVFWKLRTNIKNVQQMSRKYNIFQYYHANIFSSAF